MNHKTVARIALGTIAALELGAGIARAKARRDLFAQALARSNATGRPLVVVGDPDAGAWTKYLAREYGCGSICIDLAGCPACPVAIPADITRPIAQVPANSAVVFVSCVLEYTPDPQAGWQEILRMAGSPDNVFMADVQPLSATAVLYPGAKYIVQRADDSGSIRVEPVTTLRKMIYGGTLAGLAIASVV